MMVYGFIARTLEDQTAFREKLTVATAIVTTMENSVRRRMRQGIGDPDWPALEESLNEIQSTLEELASAMGFGQISEESA